MKKYVLLLGNDDPPVPGVQRQEAVVYAHMWTKSVERLIEAMTLDNVAGTDGPYMPVWGVDDVAI